VAVIRGDVKFSHKTTGKTINLHEGECLAMTVDGELYASQLFSGDGKPWTTFPRAGLDTKSLSYALAFSPDGKQLAAVHRFGVGGGRVGAVQGTEPVREFKGGRCIQFSPDGQWLATADQANVRIYDTRRLELVREFLFKESRARVQCLAFSADSKSLAVGRVAVKDTGAVELWDVSTGAIRSHGAAHLGAITCLAFSPDGRFLASGSTDKSVIVWDMGVGKESARFIANPPQPVWSLAFDPESRLLAIGTGPSDTRIRQVSDVCLWDFITDKIQARLHGHSRAVTSVLFSKDGQTVITGSADATVRFWDVKTSRQYGMLKGHKAAPGFEAIVVALSPDGASLATASLDQTVRIWPTTWIRVQRPVGGVSF
jgi:WD40 repeat protein